MNQFVAIGILEQAGASVKVAGNGAEALALLGQGADYDVILMDVQMPVMDGLSATRIIRSELALTIPVIAMSAGVLATERAGCIEAGMNAFIAKPLEVDEMLNVVARYLPPRATAGGAAATAPGRAAATALPGAAHVAAALDTASSAPAPQPDQNGIFSAEGLLKLSRGNEAQRIALLALIEKMLRLAPEEMQRARAALNEGRTQDAARGLHSLRGSVGIVEAKRFVAACLAVEEAVREQAHDGHIDAMFNAAEEALRITVAAGQAWLAQRNEAAK